MTCTAWDGVERETIVCPCKRCQCLRDGRAIVGFFNFNPKPTRLPSGVTDDDQDDVEVKDEVTKPAACPRCGSSRIEPSRDRDKHWFCKGCGWEK